MADRAPLALEIGRPVIEDLGIKLYGKLPPVVSEIVANSWDADAKRVEIRLPEGPLDKGSTITVADDGTGMSYDDIAKRYLRIGRKRRDEDGMDRSAGGRRIMGRKGIGKLSAFGAACTVTVSTTRDGRRTTFRMNIDDILGSAKASNAYRPVVIDDNVETGDADGTVVSLTELKRSSPVDPVSIRRGGRKALSGVRRGVRGARERKADRPDRQGMERRHRKGVGCRPRARQPGRPPGMDSVRKDSRVEKAA